MVGSLLPTAALVLWGLASPVFAADAPPVPTNAAIAEQKLAEIKPGTTTKDQVQAILGAPWRAEHYTDAYEGEDELWEYRGADAGGSYRIHIEFDSHDIVHVIGKVPDKVVAGKGTVMRTEPGASGSTPPADDKKSGVAAPARVPVTPRP